MQQVDSTLRAELEQAVEDAQATRRALSRQLQQGLERQLLIIAMDRMLTDAQRARLTPVDRGLLDEIVSRDKPL